MYVIKASGEKQPFRPGKIAKTCVRAGASKQLAREVAEEVTSQVYDGMTTKEILNLTLKLLKKEKPCVAARYNLKQAIAKLGPAGYQFESFVTEMLKEYGYKASMPPADINGACISHEIDVVADKDGITSMIECKYRHARGIYIGIKEILYTWARFFDLFDGHKLGKCQKFDDCWLICNTKFSKDAIKYALCRKMRLIGWSYPKGESLERMIEDREIYPITVLSKLDDDSQEKFAQAGLLFCRDLRRFSIEQLRNKTKIKKEKLFDLVGEAEAFFESNGKKQKV